MTTTKVCEKCGGSDFTPKGKCRPCKKAANDAYRAKAAGGGSALKTKAKKPTKAAAAALVVDACFGFSASITDEGYLQVQQRDQQGEVTDTLVLSRQEFRQLVDKFTAWAAG